MSVFGKYEGAKIEDAEPSSTIEQNKLRIVSWTKGIMIIELIDFAQKFNCFSWKIFGAKYRFLFDLGIFMLIGKVSMKTVRFEKLPDHHADFEMRFGF